ncbi:MAG: epoxyqueuosine reductase QueH [Lactobacillaceae bacterium]|jgi:predicted adenine nucleotide alpha hydrolase (AANH) superfamily ATPase|nr:epoxyqueuosine reductase QueH [Lactobacillaceae bacterium]
MKQKILLLSCCAPCSCAVVEKMARDKNDVTVVFYNPNISPLEEYQKRLKENKRLCELHNIPFIDLEYDNERWRGLVKGLENEPERGARCDVCFYMRIKRVMEYAKENGFDAVASVLGVSRYKDSNQVERNAEKASLETGVEYARIEGRKGGMQERRASLIKELNLYDQSYCGCKFKY